MSIAGLHRGVMIVLQLLLLTPASAADDPGSRFGEEMQKQQRIYQTDEEKMLENYVIDRSLENYAGALASGFEGTLAALGPNDRWLDVGAGKGFAILDYYTSNYDYRHPEGREKRGSKAQSVAISIEDRRTFLWHKTSAMLATTKMKYLFGKGLQEYALEDLGKYQLISDVIGGFSYSANLSLFMEKVLELLELNGSFFTVLQDVNSQDGGNKAFYPGASFLTEISKADDSEVKVCSWLKSISCVEVACEFKTGWRPPIETFRIRKTCNAVSVPPLSPVHFKAGTPPERRYRVGN